MLLQQWRVELSWLEQGGTEGDFIERTLKLAVQQVGQAASTVEQRLCWPKIAETLSVADELSITRICLAECSPLTLPGWAVRDMRVITHQPL